MTTRALSFANSVAAQCEPQNVSSSPAWLQVTQAAGAMATTIGVLTALYIALIREPREAFEAHKYHVARMDQWRRITRERFAAQARKLVPSCVRTPILGDTSWAVRIDNAGSKAAAILSVEVAAVGPDGVEIPDGCWHVGHSTSDDPDVGRSIRLALEESLETAMDRPFVGPVRQAIRDAVAVHFVNQWPRTLPPNQHAVMCYAAAEPGHKLRVTVDYEDEAGFQWRRTDSGQPQRTDEPDDLNPVSVWQPW
ncbi:hypothetical protein OS122_27310 [Mycolicibacterium mucogenicum]|uniref:hypothetical protein n=1 Tax=Mycolicibacterium mucogenicum TaxID=56689 RepID=UPI002269AB80|nr:hypothetical protein [Mycolicibacterium mucogenicum]MCX8564597.1 hypothetical protein [Mycolicibacterium mucogenicum]